MAECFCVINRAHAFCQDKCVNYVRYCTKPFLKYTFGRNVPRKIVSSFVEMISEVKI